MCRGCAGSAADCRHTVRRHRGGRRNGRGRPVGASGRGVAHRAIAGGGLGELQLGGGGLQVVAQEDGVVTVAGGVDADAEAARRCGGGSGCGSMGPSAKEEVDRAVAARVLRRMSDGEEACDQRSGPQDVTSSWVQRGGVNLQQEVAPQQTEKPPRDSPVEDTPDTTSGSKSNIQADGAGTTVSRAMKYLQPAPAAELGRFDYRQQVRNGN